MDGFELARINSAKIDQLQELCYELGRNQERKDESFRDLEREFRFLAEEYDRQTQEMQELRLAIEDNAQATNATADQCLECIEKLEEKFSETSCKLLDSVRPIFEYIAVLMEKAEEFEGQLKALIDAYPENTLKVFGFVREQLGSFREIIQDTKQQFKEKMDLIKEESYKSEVAFKENFPALIHGTEEKRDNGLGARLFKARPKNSIIKNGIVKTIKVQFNNREGIPIKNKYADPATGTKEIVARVLTVKEPPQQRKGVIQGAQRLLRNTFAGSTPEEKTILLVGVTGAGKSTLVDAIVNYVFNVRFEDDYRFKLVNLTEGEKKKQRNQALSQTEIITIYKIPHMEGSSVPFSLNIIDTPGVGDTGGIKKDKELLAKLETIFSPDNHLTISNLDAICFVSNAGKPRLDPAQQYIFERIITNFGVDMVNNIIGLFTFDDNNPPKVLHAFQAADIHLASHFTFNSMGVVEDKKVGGRVDKSILMGEDYQLASKYQAFYTSCDKLMGTLASMKSIPTAQTYSVMETRQMIEMNICNLQFNLRKLLAQKETVREEKAILQKYMADENANKDYEYTVPEERITTEPLEPGIYVTNCRTCNMTCHYPCHVPDDDQKAHCSAMSPRSDVDNAHCTQCVRKCFWDEHSNMQWRFIITRVEVKKTAAEVLAKYEEAVKNKDGQTDALEEAEEALEELSEQIQETVGEIQAHINRLNSIALKTASTNSAAYLQQMIDTEDMKREAGYRDRIQILEEEKKTAEMMDTMMSGGVLSGNINVRGINPKRKDLQLKKANMQEEYAGYDKSMEHKKPAGGDSAEPDDNPQDNNEDLRVEIQSQKIVKHIKASVPKVQSHSDVFKAVKIGMKSAKQSMDMLSSSLEGRGGGVVRGRRSASLNNERRRPLAAASSSRGRQPYQDEFQGTERRGVDGGSLRRCASRESLPESGFPRRPSSAASNWRTGRQIHEDEYGATERGGREGMQRRASKESLPESGFSWGPSAASNSRTGRQSYQDEVEATERGGGERMLRRALRESLPESVSSRRPLSASNSRTGRQSYQDEVEATERGGGERMLRRASRESLLESVSSRRPFTAASNSRGGRHLDQDEYGATERGGGGVGMPRVPSRESLAESGFSRRPFSAASNFGGGRQLHQDEFEATERGGENMRRRTPREPLPEPGASFTNRRMLRSQFGGSSDNGSRFNKRNFRESSLESHSDMNKRRKAIYPLTNDDIGCDRPSMQSQKKEGIDDEYLYGDDRRGRFEARNKFRENNGFKEEYDEPPMQASRNERFAGRRPLSKSALDSRESFGGFDSWRRYRVDHHDREDNSSRRGGGDDERDGGRTKLTRSSIRAVSPSRLLADPGTQNRQRTAGQQQLETIVQSPLDRQKNQSGDRPSTAADAMDRNQVETNGTGTSEPSDEAEMSGTPANARQTNIDESHAGSADDAMPENDAETSAPAAHAMVTKATEDNTAAASNASDRNDKERNNPAANVSGNEFNSTGDGKEKPKAPTADAVDRNGAETDAPDATKKNDPKATEDDTKIADADKSAPPTAVSNDDEEMTETVAAKGVKAAFVVVDDHDNVINISSSDDDLTDGDIEIEEFDKETKGYVSVKSESKKINVEKENVQVYEEVMNQIDVSKILKNKTGLANLKKVIKFENLSDSEQEEVINALNCIVLDNKDQQMTLSDFIWCLFCDRSVESFHVKEKMMMNLVLMLEDREVAEDLLDSYNNCGMGIKQVIEDITSNAPDDWLA